MNPQSFGLNLENRIIVNKFQNAADHIDKIMLNKKQVEVAVGIYQDSVFLKLYKSQ